MNLNKTFNFWSGAGKITVHPSFYAGGPGSGRHKTGRKEKKRDEFRQKKALESYNPSTAAKQMKATENEKKLVQSLKGAIHLGDHAPFDVMIPKARIGIEVKSKFDGKNNTITMHPSSRERKEQAAKTMKLKATYTVIFDDRHGKMYLGVGVKSFRIKLRSGEDNPSLRETSLSNIKDLIK